jgi:transcriptional regulator with XRE-family HTH domain
MANKNVHETESPRWANIATSVMKDKNITQSDLCSVFGVTTRGAVGHYLRGRRQPTLDQMLALSKYLGLTLSELVGEVPLSPDSEYKKEADRLFQEISEDGHAILVGALRGVAAQLPRKNDSENQ